VSKEKRGVEETHNFTVMFGKKFLFMSLSRNLGKKKETEEKFVKAVKRSLLLEGFYVDPCQGKSHPRECFLLRSFDHLCVSRPRYSIQLSPMSEL
jgi:hypothetical protein